MLESSSRSDPASALPLSRKVTARGVPGVRLAAPNARSAGAAPHHRTLHAAREIAAGLVRSRARISPKYFYDARGSLLFEQITHLPEYYPTRIEREIMAAHAVDLAAKVGPGGTVIELGAGNCAKARRLFELIRPSRFVGVDISIEFLHAAIATLRADFPGLDACAVAADLSADLVLPADIAPTRRLVFYPGSSIGNFDPPEALALLSRIRRLLDGDEGTLLLSVDLHKDVDILEAAYNDIGGVTAAFNLNLLNHVNRLLGSDFDPRQWRHRAFFNANDSRIEMHLAAVQATRVRWPGGLRRFAGGETIHTENSYKYRLGDVVDLLARAGFQRTDAWTDARDWFAVMLARP